MLGHHCCEEVGIRLIPTATGNRSPQAAAAVWSTSTPTSRAFGPSKKASWSKPPRETPRSRGPGHVGPHERLQGSAGRCRSSGPTCRRAGPPCWPRNGRTVGCARPSANRRRGRTRPGRTRWPLPSRRDLGTGSRPRSRSRSPPAAGHCERSPRGYRPVRDPLRARRAMPQQPWGAPEVRATMSAVTTVAGSRSGPVIPSLSLIAPHLGATIPAAVSARGRRITCRMPSREPWSSISGSTRPGPPRSRIIWRPTLGRWPPGSTTQGGPGRLPARGPAGRLHVPSRTHPGAVRRHRSHVGRRSDRTGSTKRLRDGVEQRSLVGTAHLRS